MSKSTRSIEPDVRGAAGAGEAAGPGVLPAPPRESGLGAPSPVEAWRPPVAAPLFLREPRLFARWVAATHRETVEDNPVFIKSVMRRYVRRPRRWPPLARDLVTGALFAAGALLSIMVLNRLGGHSFQFQTAPYRYFGVALGAVYLVSLLTGGFTMARRASRFVSTTDKAMMWEDLALTPLREEHFLWAWVWSPLIERVRHVALAATIGTAGVMLSPYMERLAEPSWGVWPLVSLGLAVLMMALFGLAFSLAASVMGLIQSLDLGPRLYDGVGLLWGLLHLAPVALGVALELGAAGCLIAGLLNHPAWLVLSGLFSVSATVVVAWSCWLLYHYLLPGFWDSLLARREVRAQKSWWRALLGK